jgi:hypothetical protein
MINNGRFQVLFRRRQNQANLPTPDDPLVNVIVVGDPSTGAARYVPGNVDNVTPFMEIEPVDGWYDFSNYVEDTEGSTFTWDKTNQGDSKNAQSNANGSNYDKGVSANLRLFDKAFQFVYNWEVLFDYQIVNCVEVKIIDLIARAKNPDPAGNYRIFEIKNDNLDFAPFDEPCEFFCKLREQDLIWHCIHKTIIHDDWQKWFNEDGTSTKEHPTFLTCIEPRPRLVQSARMALMMFFHGIKTGIFPIALVIDWITDAPSPREDARRILNANRFIEAPFIYTLLQNVALKCGMTTDTIFDQGREWEKLCLFFPRGGEMHESESDDIIAPAQTFHWGNRWDIAIPDLFDKLKLVFNAEWYVTPQNKIVFAYVKDLIKLDPIYDFTLPDAVKIYHLRYSFNGNKKPAYGSYRYQVDPVDEASQEINPLYSDTIGFDQGNNPMLEGDLTKNFEFAPTAFVRDGRAKDYMKLLIHDGEYGALILLGIIGVIAAAVVLSNLSIVTIPLSIAVGVMLFATATAIIAQSKKFQDDFINNDTYTGAVRLTAEQTTVARLLLWDGVQDDRAKVVRNTGLPPIFPDYNLKNIPYNVRNIIDKDNPGQLIFNYPLYFDGFYYGNMFPKYHDMIDNPLKSRESNQTVKFEVDLCPEMLNLFGVFQNQFAQIGRIVKVEERDNYDVFGKLTNILVDYPGNVISITGQVIRRPSSGAQIPDDQNPGNLPTPVPDDDDPTPPPIGPVCFRWTNGGDVASTVTYIDCDGATVTDAVIQPAFNFCAREILAQLPATIFAGANCDNDIPPINGNCIKVYRASVSPAFCSTDDPSVIEHENTLGPVVWTRVSDGTYRGTLAGAFVIGKTWYQGNEPVPLGQGFVTYFHSSPDYIQIQTFDDTESDCVLGEARADVEVYVYCNDCTPPDTAGITAELDNDPCLDQEIQIAIAAPGLPDNSYIVNWSATNVTPNIGSSLVDFVSGNAVLALGLFPDGLGPTTVTITGIQLALSTIPCAAVLNLEVDFDVVGAKAYAGADAIAITDYTVTDAMAFGDVISILWTTSGDGTFDDATLVNPTYTPGSSDQALGQATLTMTITTSEGGACATATDSVVINFPAAMMSIVIETRAANVTTTSWSTGIPAWPTTEYVDWGDGSPLEAVPVGSGGNMSLEHTYATADTYTMTVYYLTGHLPANLFIPETADLGVLDVDLIPAAGVFPFINTYALHDIVNLNDVIDHIGGFQEGQPVQFLILSGDPASTDTTQDFTFPGTLVFSNLHQISLIGFPNLQSITNVNVGGGGGSNVTAVNIQDCPAFNDLDSGNTWKPVFLGITNCPAFSYASLPTMDWSIATNIQIRTGTTLSVADVNQILIDVDAAGTTPPTPGAYFLGLDGQVPAAAPTGAGATAKANLISRGWTVFTD